MILTTVALFSCTNKNVQLVSNYEQQLSKNVKIDLKFKCKTFEKINDVYNVDSTKYYQNIIIETTKWSAESISDNLIKYDTLKNRATHTYELNNKEIDIISKKIDAIFRGKTTNASLDKVDKLLEISKNLLKDNDVDKVYYDANKLTNMTDESNELKDNLDKTFRAYKNYKNMPNTLLCTKYKCVYTIFNPMVNAKQEITKTYYISNNKIIKTEV